MREIKFRAWDSKTEKYFPPDVDEYWTFSIIGETTMGHLLHHYRIEDYNNLIIEQFTGLTDKNGKEVYEGDLISFWYGKIYESKTGNLVYYDKKYKRCANSVREVVFYNCSFRIKDGNPLLSRYLSEKEIEVIGNIHQDRHLLKDLT